MEHTYAHREPLKSFSDLPLSEFDRVNYSIYIIDYGWNYLFANTFALNTTGNIPFVGKNIADVWTQFPNVNFKSKYELLRYGVERKSPLQLKTISPFSNRFVEVKGFPLSDCYFISSVELPDKDALIQELKTFLGRNKNPNS